MQKITPFLWFNDQALEAARFYTSVFKKGSKVGRISRYGESGPGPKGSVMTVAFRIAGQDLVALNGGPHFQFTHAISFVVDCATQKEVDTFWDKLSAGGATEQCGWLQDRYGLSWQIVPTVLPKMLVDPNAARRERVMQAMMQMTKLDIAELKKAYGSTTKRKKKR